MVSLSFPVLVNLKQFALHYCFYSRTFWSLKKFQIDFWPPPLLSCFLLLRLYPKQQRFEGTSPHLTMRNYTQKVS